MNVFPVRPCSHRIVVLYDAVIRRVARYALQWLREHMEEHQHFLDMLSSCLELSQCTDSSHLFTLPSSAHPEPANEADHQQRCAVLLNAWVSAVLQRPELVPKVLHHFLNEPRLPEILAQAKEPNQHLAGTVAVFSCLQKLLENQLTARQPRPSLGDSSTDSFVAEFQPEPQAQRLASDMLGRVLVLVALTANETTEAGFALDTALQLLKRSETALPIISLYLNALEALRILDHRWPIFANQIITVARSLLLGQMPALVRVHKRLTASKHAADYEDALTTLCSQLARLLRANTVDSPRQLTAMKEFLSSVTSHLHLAETNVRAICIVNAARVICELFRYTRGLNNATEFDKLLQHCILNFRSIALRPDLKVDASIAEAIARLGAINPAAFERSFDCLLQMLLHVCKPESKAETPNSPLSTRAATTTALPSSMGPVDSANSNPTPLIHQNSPSVLALVGTSIASNDIPAYAGVVQDQLLKLCGAAIAVASSHHLERLATVFVQMARQTLMTIPATDSLSERRQRMWPLLCCVGTLASHFQGSTPPVFSDEAVATMRTLWCTLVLLDFHTDQAEIEQPKLHEALVNLASVMPRLVAAQVASYFDAEVEATLDRFKAHLTPTRVAQLTKQLSAALPQHPELSQEVARLSPNFALYVLAIIHAERLRFEDPEANFFVTFSYLEHRGLLQPSRLRVVTGLVEALFEKYLAVLAQQRSGRRASSRAEDLAIFLLVQFTHRFTEVSAVADRLLPLMTKRFPFVVWSDRVISACLDLVDLVHKNMKAFDPVSLNCEVELPYPPYKCVLPALLEARLRILSTFKKRCVDLVTHALQHSAKETTAILQAYISRLSSHELSTRDHPGLEVALRCLNCSAEDHGSSIPSLLGPALALRNRYRGELLGILLSKNSSQNKVGGTSESVLSYEHLHDDNGLDSTVLPLPNAELAPDVQYPGLEEWRGNVLDRLHGLTDLLIVARERSLANDELVSLPRNLRQQLGLDDEASTLTHLIELFDEA
ncbi:uncharacterized protein MONBRDRAFT_21897, partial [Monosiga brevicollis MX1]